MEVNLKEAAAVHNVECMLFYIPLSRARDQSHFPLLERDHPVLRRFRESLGGNVKRRRRLRRFQRRFPPFRIGAPAVPGRGRTLLRDVLNQTFQETRYGCVDVPILS